METEKIKLMDDSMRKAYYRMADSIHGFKMLVKSDSQLRSDIECIEWANELASLLSLVSDHLNTNYIWD